MSGMMDAFEFAQNAASAGLTPVPVRQGSKSPALEKYESWHTTRPDAETAVAACRGFHDVGVLCGEFEVIDLDPKNSDRSLNTLFFDALAEIEGGVEAFQKCYFEETPSGGCHIVLNARNLTPEKSSVLAYGPDLEKPGKWRGIVDYLSWGRYVKTWPSEKYKKLSDIHFWQAEPLSEEERAMLRRAAMSLNVRPAETYSERAYVRTEGVILQEDRVGDKFNKSVSPSEMIALLEKHGFVQKRASGDRVTFSRPGAKTRGVDADFNVKHMTFLPYSSSIENFEQRPYGPFSTYAILEHGGDFKAAATALAPRFKAVDSDPLVPKAPSVSSTEVADDTEDLLGLTPSPWEDFDKKYKVSASKAPKNEAPAWTLRTGSPADFTLKHNFLSAQGGFAVITGPEKTWKSSFIAAAIASAVSGVEILGQNLSIEGPILQIDTEQPEFYVHKGYMRQLLLADTKSDPDKLFTFQLRTMSPAQRLDAVLNLYDRIKPGMVVIDGIADLMIDVNDGPASEKLVAELMRMGTDGCLVLAVLHKNKGGEKTLRGHLGSAVLRKADTIVEMAPVIGTEDCVDVSPYRTRGLKFPPVTFQAQTKYNILVPFGEPLPMRLKNL